MKRKKDVMGREPEVGDTIIFTPPGYKNMVKGICIGFQSSGCPRVSGETGSQHVDFFIKKEGFFSVKTDFVSINVYSANLQKIIKEND